MFRVPRPLPFLRPPGFIFYFLFTKKEKKKTKLRKIYRKNKYLRVRKLLHRLSRALSTSCSYKYYRKIGLRLRKSLNEMYRLTVTPRIVGNLKWRPF